jgi:hypothetical protein
LFIELVYFVDGAHNVCVDQIEDPVVSKVVLDIAKLLVKNGCDVTLRRSDGYTAAMQALQQVG